MCGIAGILNLTSSRPIEPRTLRQMLALLRHRGPDQFGLYLDSQVGLGSARLSIIDLCSGQQPISNEDGTLWLVFNGEIFNYLELRPLLEKNGHRLATQTDTEVILHLYEDLGPSCLTRLNGQFALALWDTRKRTLFLARDRLGVRPLFYTIAEGALIFGSEIKALLADPRVRAEIDPVSLGQIFVFWSTLSPRTAFRGIVEVPPGHYVLVHNGQLVVAPYWRLNFPRSSPLSVTGQSPVACHTSAGELLEEFRSLLVDATRIRLRADVPVGAYLSGGLDSSTIAAIVCNHTNNRLETFSITFSDPNFDESAHQLRMARFLGTTHHIVHIAPPDIARVFPEVIWHVETPILRTAPAPLFLLSKRVHDLRFKVVLTGEGADEFLAGYDLFKEAKIRRFWAQQPHSILRPLLFKRLYADIPGLRGHHDAYLAAFFGQGLLNVDARDYSHHIRWHNTSRTRRFFSAEINHILATQAWPMDDHIVYPDDFDRWSPLARAQYLEISIFLSQYLLSSQGDRVAMAHSVEGRFPFLDHRVVEFCNRLPAHFKLRGLTDKYLLRQLAREWLPEETWQRPKRPYRAPIHQCFFNADAPGYVREMLSPDQIKAAGLFSPEAVEQLVKKLEHGANLSETDDMALVGILSSQLVYQQFVADFRMPPPLSADDMKMCLGEEISLGGTR